MEECTVLRTLTDREKLLAAMCLSIQEVVEVFEERGRRGSHSHEFMDWARGWANDEPAACRTLNSQLCLGKLPAAHHEDHSCLGGVARISMRGLGYGKGAQSSTSTGGMPTPPSLHGNGRSNDTIHHDSDRVQQTPGTMT